MGKQVVANPGFGSIWMMEKAASETEVGSRASRNHGRVRRRAVDRLLFLNASFHRERRPEEVD